jgi:alkylhydroperoxidase family enzyme
MPRIAIPSPEELPEDLRPYVRDPFYGVLANRPEILVAWAELDKAFFGPGSRLPGDLKEEGRRALASDLGCVLCASYGVPRQAEVDAREALVVAIAEQIGKDHRQIDESTFEALRQEFDDREIVELLSWLCFKLGANVFGALMSFEPATEAQKAAYAEVVAGNPVS